MTAVVLVVVVYCRREQRGRAGTGANGRMRECLYERRPVTFKDSTTGRSAMRTALNPSMGYFFVLCL